ncbi:MAG: hypothetical protein C4525_07225 [Desulfarculus sp.]|nr:MAG: hypothetical protein C4525_07225 [Desulfarculus sp.]
MSGPKATLPPEVRRFSGLYRFIDPERFAELGIDPEDVPLGTYPAEDHPPFLPDRLGGNAYGLGLFEHTALAPEDARLMDRVDLSDPAQAAASHRRLNEIFKRLGLLIRYSRQGRRFFLIPRHYVAQFLVEVRARAEEITGFLSGLLARRLRERMRVGLLATEHELLLPELQSRMPQLEFSLLSRLSHLTARRPPLDALVLVGDPLQFALELLAGQELPAPGDRQGREDLGRFMASRLYDLLDADGELLCLADRPPSPSSRLVKVRFKSQLEFKRFLMFSHVYRTHRRYRSRAGLEMELNGFDFEAFLMGPGVYHETVEGLLEGKSLAQMEPRELDRLPYQNLPLPRGSDERMLAAWGRWLSRLFEAIRLDRVLPEVQRAEWEAHYQTSGGFPPTMLIFQGSRRRPLETLAEVENRVRRRRIGGCPRALLADYKDSFTYVARVLEILEQVRQGVYTKLPGLELSRLRKPFETAAGHRQFKHVRRLMELAPRLARWEARLNPQGVMGARTPVLAHLEKLSLLGLEPGPLYQLLLIVLGHSTMSRVTFGKLPETTLEPLTDRGRYRDLEEAVTVIRLYRLLSVAEAAAASPGGLSPGQVREMFNLYDLAIQVVSDPELSWGQILDAQINQSGGVQAKATRKMLKLLDFFDHLEDWQSLEAVGPREKEALADFDPLKLTRIGQVIELVQQERRFVERFYAGDSSARPYFFRALLNSELHGTGRLLPKLGAAASFTLLWICVHASERRLINCNPLLMSEGEIDLAERLAKLRRALLRFTPDQLNPQWLAGLRRGLAAGRQVYLGDSGLYLSLDRDSGALTPQFIDPNVELALLSQLLGQTEGRALEQAPPRHLQVMDRSSHEARLFLEAQRSRLAGRQLLDLEQTLARLQGRLQGYVLRELLDLPRFAGNLGLLLQHCPHLMDRLLPQPSGHPLSRRRLAAAAKLSALELKRLEGFQDMQLSHQMARQEFGAAAAGIVGVSPLQFQRLTASLGQLLHGQPGLGRLLMLAVLLYAEQGPPPELAASPLLAGLELSPAETGDLGFLLAQHDLSRRVVSGEASLRALQPVLDCQDPPLVEALFLLSVICGGARREGFLTEDLMEGYNRVLEAIRRLSLGRTTSGQALRELIADMGRRLLAFERYQELQQGPAPAASLRHLLETQKLPPEGREHWLEQGQRLLGLDRLLKLRGLLLVDGLDLRMLAGGVPVRFIYQLKNLRSVGVTHYERDLYEGRRLYRALRDLPPAVQEFVLDTLGGPRRPLTVTGFAQAAERLTYANQILLLLLGLCATGLLPEEHPGPLSLDFQPLARLMHRKFEMVNELITGLEPLALLHRAGALRRMVGAREGLVLHLEPQAGLVSLAAADPLRLDRKIQAVRRASSPGKLKRLYHGELKKLAVAAHGSLDYQQRLEEAFQENLQRLGGQMLERVRERLAAEDDLQRLEAQFKAAREEGLELPLSQDRQQSLRDLYEMNAERLRRRLLGDISAQVASINTFAELEDYWGRVKARLRELRPHLSKEFQLAVSRRFDHRAQILRAKAQEMP